MTPEELQNELDTPLIGGVERHPLTSNKSTIMSSPNMTGPSRDASFNEVDSTATESSAQLSHTTPNPMHCHHHLCHDSNSHAHQQRNHRQSRHIEPSATARVSENQNQNEQNIYTNHPDDQSDSDEAPNVSKLPHRPQMTKLPCRNRCTCHEHHHHQHHHQIQHHNHIQNDTWVGAIGLRQTCLNFIAFFSPFHSKFGSQNCQHMRRKIQRPGANVSNATRCNGSATKRIVARRPSNDLIETAIDKLEEIGSDSEAGPPLPPRPPMSRQRFSLSMETGKRSPID